MGSVEESKKQALTDIIVAVTALPLLITCAVILHSTMRSDWLRNSGMRWRILGLGLSLLFISLLVCLYVTQRLGMCIWKAQQRPTTTTERIRRRTISSRGGLPAPLIATDSEMRLMVGGELPPSYDSVISCMEQPPPYSSIIVQDEKTEISRSLDGPYPCIVVTAPPGTG